MNFVSALQNFTMDPLYSLFKLTPSPTLIIIYIGTHANTRSIKGMM